MALTSVIPPSRQSPSFTCFSLLAPELRRQIWALCLPSPRIISIAYVGKTSCTSYRLSSPPPVLLYINQESRSFILERYKRLFLQSQSYALCFQSPTVTECSWHDQHYVWVDPERDVLFYENDYNQICSSQWFRVREMSSGIRYDIGHQKKFPLRNHRTLSPWMVRPEQTMRLDSTISHIEKIGDDNDASVLHQIARIAVPFDEIYVGPNESFCGTGYLHKINLHQQNLTGLVGALKSHFSSLRDVIIVVDREREDAKRQEKVVNRKKRDQAWKDYEEENQKGKEHSKQVEEKLFGFDMDGFLDGSRSWLTTRFTSGKNVELIDFRPSERYGIERCTEMEDEIRNWFRNVGEEDSRPWSAGAVKMMEVRPKQERDLDFTWLPATN